VSAVRLLGAVLAGGRSRRFGRDKAAEEIGGVAMVERAVRALGAATDAVAVIGGRVRPAGAARVDDLRPGAGPLAGIEAALAAARDRDLDGVLVLACDIPLVRARTLVALREAVAGGASAAVTVAADRGDRASGDARTFEPLCAAYRTGLLADATALLDEGVRTAGALFERVGGVRVEATDGELLNVNTRDDAVAAAAALAEASS